MRALPRRAVLIAAGAAVGCGAPNATSCDEPSLGPGAGYCLLANRLVRVTGAPQLKVGQGLLLRLDDATAVVVVRDDGGFYALSAICPHACCVVSACTTQTECVAAAASCTLARPVTLGTPAFLCACHGSSFSAEGAVLSPPATTSLPAFKVRREGDELIIDTATLVRPSERV